MRLLCPLRGGVAGHPLDDRVRQALGEAGARTRRLLVSGIYPE
jgi:hypothetical protein